MRRWLSLLALLALVALALRAIARRRAAGLALDEGVGPAPDAFGAAVAQTAAGGGHFA